MTVALLDLRPNDCRFPVGDLFCAGARRDGSSYCDHHHRIAYPVRVGGGRAFSSGGFLADHTEKVAPPRPARAHETVKPDRTPPSTALLDQFVRAAAARRHDAPQYPASKPPAFQPAPPRIIVVGHYTVPVSRLETHEGRELFYLTDLAYQCASVVVSMNIYTLRGGYYAAYLRDLVAGALGMTTADIQSTRRHKELVRSRQFAMFCIAAGATKVSLPAIGREIFGGFDHTTVIHGRNRIARMISDRTLPDHLGSILDRICAFDSVIADAVRKLRAPRLEVIERETA